MKGDTSADQHAFNGQDDKGSEGSSALPEADCAKTRKAKHLLSIELLSLLYVEAMTRTAANSHCILDGLVQV